ncbi:MAG: hypothetical protein AB1768_14100, partial [Pseudomonadota bacterium]
EAFVFEQAQARDRSPQKRSFSTQRRKTLCAHSFASFAPLRCAFSGIKMHPHHHILRVDDALSHPHAWRLVPPRGWPKWRVH